MFPATPQTGAPVLAFWIAFAAAVALLLAALVTGRRGRRRAHLVLAPAAFAALAAAIVLTEQLVRHYEFPPDALRLHLWIAEIGAALALPVLVSGLWLVGSPRARPWHRLCVFVWMAAVLVTTTSGFWLFTLAAAHGA